MLFHTYIEKTERMTIGATTKNTALPPQASSSLFMLWSPEFHFWKIRIAPIIATKPPIIIETLEIGVKYSLSANRAASKPVVNQLVLWANKFKLVNRKIAISKVFFFLVFR